MGVLSLFIHKTQWRLIGGTLMLTLLKKYTQGFFSVVVYEWRGITITTKRNLRSGNSIFMPVLVVQDHTSVLWHVKKSGRSSYTGKRQLIWVDGEPIIIFYDGAHLDAILPIKDLAQASEHRPDGCLLMKLCIAEMLELTPRPTITKRDIQMLML